MFDSSLADIEEPLLSQFIPIAKTRMKTLKEFKQLIMPFLTKSEVQLSEEQKQMKDKLREQFESLNTWTIDSVVETIKRFNGENNVNFKYHYRIILGVEAGLPLGDVFVILGKEKVLALLS